MAQVGDYDAKGRAILPREYGAWIESSGNWLGDLVTTAETEEKAVLQIANPIPGTVVILDSDIRNSGSRLLLQAVGTKQARWSCKTLELRIEGDHTFAILKPGRHEIDVRDEASGLSVV